MEIIFIIFAASGFVHLLFYIFFFSRLSFYKNQAPSTQHQTPVSVIICAKNEETNLRKNLPFILEQNYPQFEVVLVNDNSNDETLMTLSQMKKKYSHLNIVTISNDNRWLKGKRFALAIGIKSAKYDTLLLTDADCFPLSKDWISIMIKSFSDKKEIVLGYSPYEKDKTFLNKCIRFDAFYTALQYFSFALADLPYMGVGRNLAYKKELFVKNKGFSPEQKNLLSGDDDLFINKVADKTNTVIEIERNSFVFSTPKKSWGSWIFQKCRHISTGIYYKAKHQFLLGLLSFTHFLFYSLLIALLILQFNYWIVLIIFFLRFIIQWCIIYKPIKLLGEFDLWIFYPLMDFLTFIFYLTLAPALFFTRVRKWK